MMMSKKMAGKRGNWDKKEQNKMGQGLGGCGEAPGERGMIE
jgi:hypothetical protein